MPSSRRIKLSALILLAFMGAGCAPAKDAVQNTLSADIQPSTKTSTIIASIPAQPQPSPLPSATLAPLATPTKKPDSGRPVIDLNNSIQLKPTGKASQASPYKLIWSSDSLSFGVISENQVVVYDAKSLVSIAAYAVQQPSRILSFSNDGHTLATTSDQKTIDIVDVVKNKKISSIELPDLFLDAIFSPDQKTLGVTSSENIAVTLLDVQTGKTVKSLQGFETAAPVYSISFSPDGKSIIWLSRGHAQIMDIESGKLGPAFEHEDFIQSLALSTDGNLLVTAAGGSLDGQYVPLIQVWNTKTGQVITRLKTDSISNLAFQFRSHLLAFADGPNLKIWDFESRKPATSYKAAQEAVNFISFSPDGKTISTLSFDNAIGIWQITQ